MSRRRRAGGAATAGGMNFQHRVTAWVAVQILAEAETSPPWDLAGGNTLEWLHCETEEPVDDLMVRTSTHGIVFAQVKHTLTLSSAVTSDLASALDQFVRQFGAHRRSSPGAPLWDRPLDSARDRLVLITGRGCSEPIRLHLPTMLERLRNQTHGHPFDQAAVNNKEQKSLSIVLNHVRRSWQAARGGPPSEEELRQLLSLIRIHVLDIDTGGDAEQEAKARLRTTVLRNPAQADTAWALLVERCARLAAERSEMDRSGFQRMLIDAGIDLQASRSYRGDIERLRIHTRETADALAHLATIRVGSSEIKLNRRSTTELRRAAEEKSLLVVGEPGIGKSGALHDLVCLLADEGRDVIFFAVDRLAAQSLGELRAELGLDHGLTEILANWPGTAPAFLIIDALDAARADLTARAIRDLIRAVIGQRGRWRVAASIRKFDLRHGLEVQQLFWGEPPTHFRDSSFPNIRHLNISRLSREELAQIPSQSPLLQALIDGAPEALRDLLTIPFNLRLMAELLGAGIPPADLTPIRTQLELLERYWAYRVVRDDGQRDAREEVLRQACEGMVSNRSLRVDRSHVTAAGASLLLNDLLSAQVLTTWQPAPAAAPEEYVLTFSHHVLFDYAVARLLLRGVPERLVSRLADDPELVIVIRPSLVLHFRYLWTRDSQHDQFWQLIVRIVMTDRIPEIGKLIGPAVAAELVDNLSDLEPLCVALDHTDQETRTAAEGVFRHLVGSLLAGATGERPLVGLGAGPWCALLARVSRHLHTERAYTIRSLLTTICEHPEVLTVEQRAAAGETARRLLECAWAAPRRDQWLIGHALRAVCQTFESDLPASAALLQRCLAPERLAAYGYEELPWLSREVGRLIPFDAALVEDIYKHVFAYREVRRDPTPIGQSRILPMSSTPEQDYQMVLYRLTQVFPEFLSSAPKRAASALMAVIATYVTRRHAPSSGEVILEPFRFNGQDAWIRTDRSVSWDEGDVYRDDEPLKMLAAFERQVERLAAEEDQIEKLRVLVEVAVSENRFAIIWRRLLRLGARFPRTFGRQLLPLAWSTPILMGIDTTVPAGEFLKAVFPMLTPNQRERVERTLLSIPDAVPPERREAGERTRNRLLGCLADADLVTEDARHVLDSLRVAHALPPNEAPVRFSGWVNLPYSEREELAEQGVPVDAEVNRRIRDLERPVKEFVDRHLNAVPSAEEITAILPALQALRVALARAEADGVHPRQQAYAWGYLAAACRRIAWVESLSCEDKPGDFIRTTLLEASAHPEPVPDSERDARFAEHLSWGSYEPRIEAAEGLMVLARHRTCVTPQILQALERLNADPVPAVRYQLARQLTTLYYTAPELMWQLIERLSREESSYGVLQGLLGDTFGQLLWAHPDWVARQTQEIFRRMREGPGAEKVRELCIDVFSLLYIWRGDPMCAEIIFGIVADPAANSDDAHTVLRHLRNPLTRGPIDPPDPEEDAIRHRAFDLIARLLHAAREGLRQIEEDYRDVAPDAVPEADRARAQALARLIDDLGDQIYFASGAFAAKGQGGPDGENIPTPEVQKLFYGEAGPILDELADVGLPSLAHHLLETLEAFISFDPHGVFIRIGRVIQSGQRRGYQYESLAVDLVVALVERYLAEYRALLRESEECRQTLREILDIFVQAGWPSARRLTYRLHEIFW